MIASDKVMAKKN